MPAPDEDAAEAEAAIATHNALDGSALANNALLNNAAVSHAFVSHPLTGAALMGNALVEGALHDPNARDVLAYVASCALPAGEHFEINIEGATYGFDGELGLAPQWGSAGGRCTDRCQEWVSACVFSRVNYIGEHLVISIRGQHDALTTDLQELATYAQREAAYFGNMFEHPEQRFACLSPGETSIPRVCGDSLDSCVVSVVGDCGDVCNGPTVDGSFGGCRVHASGLLGGHGGRTKAFRRTITVFLQ